MDEKAVSGLAVNQTHYQVNSLQPIEIMQLYLTREEMIGAMKFNILKYTLRMGHKDDESKEADKIIQYSKWLANVLRGERINPHESI